MCAGRGPEIELAENQKEFMGNLMSLANLLTNEADNSDQRNLLDSIARQYLSTGAIDFSDFGTDLSTMGDLTLNGFIERVAGLEIGSIGVTEIDMNLFGANLNLIQFWSEEGSRPDGSKYAQIHFPPELTAQENIEMVGKVRSHKQTITKKLLQEQVTHVNALATALHTNPGMIQILNRITGWPINESSQNEKVEEDRLIRLYDEGIFTPKRVILELLRGLALNPDPDDKTNPGRRLIHKVIESLNPDGYATELPKMGWCIFELPQDKSVEP